MMDTLLQDAIPARLLNVSLVLFGVLLTGGVSEATVQFEEPVRNTLNFNFVECDGNANHAALVVQGEDASALDMLKEAHSFFQRAGDADGARFAATFMSVAGGASKASSKPEDHVYAGCATWEGLAKHPDQWWADHIHFQFAGELQPCRLDLTTRSEGVLTQCPTRCGTELVAVLYDLEQ
eukprot:s4995_g8.t1